MAGEIASAFVRIRPNMEGFRSETESGVRTAFSGLRKIVGGALAATGAFEFGKSIVEAASAHQAQFALLDKTLQNAGSSTKVMGQQIETLLEKEARLKGFSDESLAQSFIRIVSATKDSTKAFHDLQAAEDLSRARGIDLATAALALSKAEQGKATSLQRYGIVLPAVTAAEDALKKKRDEAIAAGAKFTAVDNQIYQAALAVAKAQDAQAKKTEALTLVTQRFGGSAGEFAKTASGQFQRLRQDIHQAEVAFGENLLPGLASAAEAVGKFATSLAHNQSALNGERSAIHALGVAFQTVKDVVSAVGPTFLTVASAAARIVSAIGSPALLAAAATYKSLTIVVGLATTAQAFYARAIAATVAPVAAATAANAALAASETAASAAGGEAAAGGFARFATGVALLGAKGGAITAAVAGLAILTGAFVYLFTRTSEAQQKMNEFARGAESLGQALNSLPSDKLAVAQARLNLETANYAVATSKAKPGSLEFKRVHLEQQQAVLSLTAALQQLGVTQGKITDSTKQTVSSLEASIQSQFKIDQFKVSRATGRPAQERLATKLEADEVAKLTTNLNNLAVAKGKAGEPLIAHNITLLKEYVQAIGKVPTAKTITFFIDNRNAKASLKDLTNALTGNLSDLKKTASSAGQDVAASFWEGLSSGIQAAANAQRSGAWPGIGQALEAAAGAAAADAKSGAAHRKIAEAASIAIKSLRDGIASDKSSLADLKVQMAEQVVQAAEAIRQAVNQSKTNFSQIGATIAGDIAQVMTAPLDVADAAIQAAGDRLAATFDRQSIKLQAQADVLNAAVSRIALAQQARAAKFAGQNALIQNQENRLSLRQDNLTLEGLRKSVILPGGKQLSSNPKEALAQLQRFAASAQGASRNAIEQFAAQYQGAVLASEKDRITIATQTSPKNATRDANLQLDAATTALQTQIANAKHAAATARLQVRSDFIRIQRDVAAARTRIAAQEIADVTDAFNRAPTAANLKKVTVKIAKLMAADHVSFANAGDVLGSAFLHGFEAQFTGLVEQGKAQGGIKGKQGGLVPQVVTPLQTIVEQQRQADSLTKQYRKTQLSEMKKQTTLLGKIHAEAVAKKFINSLGKNPGQASKNAKDLAGATG